MQGGGCRIAIIIGIVALIASGLGIFLFACIHYHNWWSLFVWMSLAMALIMPNICYGYKTEPLHLVEGAEIKESTLRTCREVGWAFSFSFWLLSYMIPILAWYNDGFYFVGALLIMVALDALALAYILWLLVFLWSV